MGNGRAGRRDHELERNGRIESRRPPHAVGAGRPAQRRGALSFTGVGGDAIDVHLRALDRPIGRRARDDTCHPPVQDDVRLGRDGDARRRAAGDEAVDVGEGDRAQSGVAMVDLPEQDVRCAFQRRSVGGHIERHARLVEDNRAVRLRIEVEAVAAQRQERHARRHFALAPIELLEERAAPVVFAAKQIVSRPDAVIGRAAERRLFDASGICRGIFTRRVAAARRTRRSPPSARRSWP